jgi:hypothetical protein
MTVINLRLTPAELNAIEVGLDTIIEQLMHPYDKDNRQKLIMALEAQEAVECALENFEKNSWPIAAYDDDPSND